MRHVGVLQCCGNLVIHFRSIRAQHQERDGELIEFHFAIVGGLVEWLAITGRLRLRPLECLSVVD